VFWLRVCGWAVVVVLQMGYSALHMACMQENEEAIKALGRSKADFNCVGPVRWWQCLRAVCSR